MADEEQLAILRQDVQAWNTWRAEHPSTPIDLAGADLRGAHLLAADLCDADLRGADLTNADLRGACLQRADLRRAGLTLTHLLEADLREANLRGANLTKTHLRGADLRGADLQYATLVKTDLAHATLSNCKVYGISAWKVHLKGAVQANLTINASDEPTITVDDLEVAQFVYLMLQNHKIRNVIDTLTNKVVLILGRFTQERKAVLDALREALRQRNKVPVLFDFDKPTNLNVTETVTLLARMAQFIIADVTDATSVAHELQAIVPHVKVPVCLLLVQHADYYALLDDIIEYPWVLPIHRYASLDALRQALQQQVIAPAEAKARAVRKLRQAKKH